MHFWPTHRLSACLPACLLFIQMEDAFVYGGDDRKLKVLIPHEVSAWKSSPAAPNNGESLATACCWMLWPSGWRHDWFIASQSFSFPNTHSQTAIEWLNLWLTNNKSLPILKLSLSGVHEPPSLLVQWSSHSKKIRDSVSVIRVQYCQAARCGGGGLRPFYLHYVTTRHITWLIVRPGNLSFRQAHHSETGNRAK